MNSSAIMKQDMADGWHFGLPHEYYHGAICSSYRKSSWKTLSIGPLPFKATCASLCLMPYKTLMVCRYFHNICPHSIRL